MLNLPPELGHGQVVQALQDLSKAMLASLRAGQVVQLNAAKLQRFDSSAVALLLELRREVQARGASLHVTAQPDRLRELLSLYGVGELLPA